MKHTWPLLIVLLLLLGCSQPPSPFASKPPNMPPAWGDLKITLSREAGDFCGGQMYELTVNGDGLVVYHGIKCVRVTGIRTSTLTHDQLQALVDAFQAAGYFSLADSYVKWQATDMDMAVTSLTLGGRTKKIVHYSGGTSPKKLTVLEDQIDTITNSAQWVKR